MYTVTFNGHEGKTKYQTINEARREANRIVAEYGFSAGINKVFKTPNTLGEIMDAIAVIKEKSENVTVHSSDDFGWEYYFAVSGHDDETGKYFDFYFTKRHGKVQFEESHVCEISLEEILN